MPRPRGAASFPPALEASTEQPDRPPTWTHRPLQTVQSVLIDFAPCCLGRPAATATTATTGSATTTAGSTAAARATDRSLADSDDPRIRPPRRAVCLPRSHQAGNVLAQEAFAARHRTDQDRSPLGPLPRASRLLDQQGRGAVAHRKTQRGAGRQAAGPGHRARRRRNGSSPRSCAPPTSLGEPHRGTTVRAKAPGVRPSTAKRELATLSAALNWCWRNKRLDRPVVVTLPKVAESRERQRGCCSAMGRTRLQQGRLA